MNDGFAKGYLLNDLQQARTAVLGKLDGLHWGAEFAATEDETRDEIIASSTGWPRPTAMPATPTSFANKSTARPASDT